jgi:polyhydroxybutyrate depolymerase
MIINLLSSSSARLRRCLSIAMGSLIGMALIAVAHPSTAHTLAQTPADIASPDIASPEISSPEISSADTPQLQAAALATTSPGCGRAGHHSTGVFTWTTTDGKKRTRKFLMQVPAEYDPNKAYSLNFVFHGAGGSSSQSYSWGLQNVSGASENGIFIFPDGIDYENYGIGWDDTSKGYDIPFFDNMVKDVETYFCIDQQRLFVAGFSWGGDFVTSLVCNRGNSIRAAAINSTNDEFTQSSNYLTYQNMPCPTTVHPAVRFEHAVGGDSEYPAPDFANTSKLVQHFNSCNSTSVKVASSTTVMSCQSYSGCSNEFIECPFNAGIGHALPPNWASDTWGFFSTFK